MKSTALILILFLSNLAFSQGKNFIDQPYIESNGSVDTMVTPDKIFLDILLTEKDTKNRTSIETLEKRMVDELVQLKIDVKSKLTVDDLSSNFKRSFLSGQEIYKTKRFLLELASASMAGEVVRALEKKDISNVYLSHTEYSKMNELQLQLKIKAVKSAKNEAQSLAEALGQSIGSALFVSENANQYYAQARSMKMMEVKLDSVGSNAEIEIQKIKVECKINVKFKLLEE